MPGLAGPVPRPIFIIGTSRCGSTVLTDVFKTHAGLAVFPTEANELWHPALFPFHQRTVNSPEFHEDPRKFSELSLANWPPGHRQLLYDTYSGFHALAGRSRQFLLKCAMLSFMLPAVLDLYPDARLIHIYRSGPSVVESMVSRGISKSQSLNTQTAPEAALRASCASYWNECMLEIDHFKNERGLAGKGQYSELSYEELCAQPAETMRRLADFLHIDPLVFKYDFTKIKSTNYKAGNYAADPRWAELLDIIRPAMTLKGYWPN